MLMYNAKKALAIFGIAAAATISISSAGSATTIHQAFSTPTGTVGNQSYTQHLGQDFRVNADHIKITDIGYFDSGNNGVQGQGITVHIYDLDNNVSLYQDTFTMMEGTPMGGYRFNSLATPLHLAQGLYSVVAIGFGHRAVQMFKPFSHHACCWSQQ